MITCKRPLIAVLVSLVDDDILTPRGSIRAFRMIAGERTPNGLLVFLHAVSRRKALVTDIAGKWFVVSDPGLGVHAERVVDASVDEKMGDQ